MAEKTYRQKVYDLHARNSSKEEIASHNLWWLDCSVEQLRIKMWHMECDLKRAKKELKKMLEEENKIYFCDKCGYWSDYCIAEKEEDE